MVMLRRLGSTVFWAFLVVSSILLFPIAVLIWAATVLFDRRLVLLHRFTCFWASLYTWLNPVWRVRVEGREKIDPNTAYVMVANHQSLLDILVLFRLFTHFKWVSKIENFRVPCIGWNMSLNRYIKLRRGDNESVEQMMAACEQTLARRQLDHDVPRGHALGGRPLEGVQARRLHPRAARRAHRFCRSSSRAPRPRCPKRGFVLQGRHAIRIRVLDAIPYARVASLSVEALTEHVRAIIAAELGEPAARESA